VFVGLLAAVRARRLRLALLSLAGCFTILALPVFARNFVFYGDPFSPFLERWRPGSDPAVIALAEFLRLDGGAVTLERVARLPWDLAATLKPGIFHDVLGLGVFGFMLALRERGPTRQLLLAALAAFPLIVVFSPVRPRFFLELYFWCAAAAVPTPSRPLKSLFVKGLTVQAIPVAGVAAYLALALFPGALTQTGRERVMTLMAPGYAEAKWLDAALPPDALLLDEEFRYHALLPRPFVVGDRFLHTDIPYWQQQLTELVKQNGVTALLTRYPISTKRYTWLATQHGTPLAGPVEFPAAARSPFNRGNSTSWMVTRLNEGVPVSKAE
jgi:hypothetical protein